MKRWNYLERIANEICPNADISVGLLIGANCAETLEPKEVISSREIGANCAEASEPKEDMISSRESDPYAVKTILDWCVLGPIL